MNTNAAMNTNGESGEGREVGYERADVTREPGAANVVTASEGEARPKERRTAAQVVSERLATIEVGEPIAHDRMVVFPLFVRDVTSPLRYRTLESALADRSVEVTEQASATVPELVMRNKSDVMIFVLDGEEIIGGQQNRVVNASFLIGANATVPLPVTCVEHGRWHSTSRTFSSGEATYHSLRSEKFAQVQASLRRSAGHTSDQGAVWSSVAAKAMAAGASSPTGAMHEIYESRRSSLEQYLGAFPYAAGASGFAVALGGALAGADLFDQPATAQALWPKLLRSYAMDALDSPQDGPVGREAAVRLFALARGAQAETYPSIALGEDVRFEGQGLVGGGLVYDETPVHISLFGVSDTTPTWSSTMARASQRRQAYQRRSQPLNRTE